MFYLIRIGRDWVKKNLEAVLICGSIVAVCGLIVIIGIVHEADLKREMTELETQVITSRGLAQERERRILDLELKIGEQQIEIAKLKEEEKDVEGKIETSRTRGRGEAKKILIPASDCARLRDIAVRLHRLGLRDTDQISCDPRQ